MLGLKLYSMNVIGLLTDRVAWKFHFEYEGKSYIILINYAKKEVEENSLPYWWSWMAQNLEQELSRIFPEVSVSKELAEGLIKQAFKHPEPEQELNWRTLPGMYEEAVCPCCCGKKYDLWEVIVELNDDHQWTREQIADWLDTLDIDLEFKVETAKV